LTFAALYDVSDCTSCTPVNHTKLKQNLTTLMRYLDLIHKKGGFSKEKLHVNSKAHETISVVLGV